MYYDNSLTGLLDLADRRLGNDRIDDDRRAELKDELTALRERAGRYQTDRGYVSHIKDSIQRASAIRSGESAPVDDPITDPNAIDEIGEIASIDWRQVPLCGCGSPTCALKRGELPAACRDRSGGLLNPRSPIERVNDWIQRHPRPHAIATAHRIYVDGYYAVMAEAKQLVSATTDFENRTNPHKDSTAGRAHASSASF